MENITEQEITDLAYTAVYMKFNRHLQGLSAFDPKYNEMLSFFNGFIVGFQYVM